MKRMWSKNELKSIISTLIESGQVPNAKPIYYHGLVCYGSYAQFQFVILNNSDTAFTKDTLIAHIKSLMDDGAIINCNGCIYVSGEDGGVFPVYLMQKVETGYRMVYHTTSSLYEYIDLEDLWAELSGVDDGVNKIN